VEEIESARNIPAAAANFLKANDLPARLRLAGDSRLSGLDWGEVETLSGPAEPQDKAGLSWAFCGIAETGTLMMVSGPQSPVTLNFLPDNHIVALRAGDIVGAYEDAWDKLRAQMDGAAMPRAVNWITGPSRTADIEQTLVLGAHGPRKLHILLVKEQER
jgi:L-lactate dehydrogenase complex protein LldG